MVPDIDPGIDPDMLPPILSWSPFMVMPGMSPFMVVLLSVLASVLALAPVSAASAGAAAHKTRATMDTMLFITLSFVNIQDRSSPLAFHTEAAAGRRIYA